MAKVKREISVTLENRPGRLAHVCGCLADRNVNLVALSAVEGKGSSVVRFVADKPKKALRMLTGSCPMKVSERDVLVAKMSNKPGALSKAAGRLGKAGINIDYVYASAGGGGKAVVVFAVPDARRAKAAVEGKKVKPAPVKKAKAKPKPKPKPKARKKAAPKAKARKARSAARPKAKRKAKRAV